mmetsp:Transcript_18658/g.17987  ORF Transcript_18658/g.17987 Transcript_18658/m.17987 type:complete len:821 (+) Transcript_18658:210-2672(+)|eukprot:CAMPEP_0119037184 /NCGR_PEP_ID=MMETSP1177-20130426/5386_1 /TAXON_ID=2985 /ORGANISM="Ochromonas sp, Strain CCMP1899" /LENGTH=820 /DNA_ID=CAMNT_0006998093 /DNA_START=181 /DNA_END=2643 /DNA_ORIENTATION=-
MLTRGAALQRNVVQISKTLNSKVHSSPQQWFDRLFNAPKGFGKFYPPGSSSSGAGKAGENAAKATKSGGGGGKKSGGGGGGGGGSGFNFEMNTGNAVAIAFIIALSLGMSTESKNEKEISFQTFQSQLLEAGQVEKILVSNKNKARIVLKSPVSVGDSMTSYDMGAGGDKQDTAAFGTGGPSGFVNDTDNGMKAESGSGSTDNDKASPFSLLQSPNNYSPYYFAIGSIESFERKLEDAQKALNIPAREYIPVFYVNETSMTKEVMNYLPVIAILGIGYFALKAAQKGGGGGLGGGKGGGIGDIFKMNKSPAKKINKEMVTTTFNDVAGCDEAKREIMEFVEFLKDSKKFTDLGAKIPKGALLCGPPGTGKTLLAKAMAGESNVPFYSISGSDFVEMFVGVGPSRVRDLFKEARANAPCIIFIDEIDAIGRQRGKGGMGGSNDERESTLNQLLVEMDGFDASTNVVILAGTNRADILDTALTRPGRFDRQIQVDKPDLQGRKAIFEVYLKGITLDGEPASYSSRLAALTPGFSGADIANICNEAAILAARRNKLKVDLKDFETATERIIGGLESKKIMSPEERRVVAYHEAGHAIAGWNLEFADPLLKVTIVPRGNGALGFAQYLPKEIFLRTREQILDMVCMALAGRAAEQVNFGRVTTGAANDLQRVTQIVYQMVQVYGMNDRVGQVAFPKEEGQWPSDRLYSNATAEIMDEEVKLIVDEAYRRTIKLMEDRKDQVILIAELLLEKETITNNDVSNLIGRRPFRQSEEYEQYASSGWGPSGTTIEAPTTELDPTAEDKEQNDSSSGPETLVAPLYSKSE